MHASIDHKPLLLEVAAEMVAVPKRSPCRVDPAAVRTAAGMEAVASAFRSLPLIPWEVDATTHVNLIHDHLRNSLAAHLPAKPRPARHPAYTEETIRAVRDKRRARKRVREIETQERQALMRIVFRTLQANCCRQTPQVAEVVEVHSEAVRHKAHVLVKLHFLTRGLSTLAQRDRADLLRTEIGQARDLGSAQFAFRIRALLRTGRKFKAPSMLPVLRTEDGAEACGRDEVLLGLGRHYAKAERGTVSTAAQCVAARAGQAVALLTHPLQASELPSLAATARAMASLKCGRASGIAGLPPEVYRVATPGGHGLLPCSFEGAPSRQDAATMVRGMRARNPQRSWPGQRA